MQTDHSSIIREGRGRGESHRPAGSGWPHPKRRCLLSASFLIFNFQFLIALSRAEISEPDNLLYGTVMIGAAPVTAANHNVVVEARRTLTGPLIASYTMGSSSAAGNYYSLRLSVESLSPLANPTSSTNGSPIYIIVRDQTGVRDQKAYAVGSRGQIARLDFGNPDSDHNGLPDDWETQYFNALGQNANGDPDLDGQTNAQEVQAGTNPLVADTRHPADKSPADHFIVISEVTAYGLAWKTGAAWTPGPSPIPIDYVTRAGLIWKNGERYRVDRTVSTTAPLWWVNAPLAPQSLRPRDALQRSSVPVASDAASLGTATRAISGNSPNSLNVAIAVTPASSVNAWAVEELLPAGASATEISHDGSVDSQNQRVRWGPFFDQVARTFTYQLASTSAMAPSLSGTVSFDGTSLTISDAGPAASRLTLTRSSTNGRLELHGVANSRYTIEVSTDLQTWTVLAHLQTDASGVVELMDQLSDGARFYRAR